jgi:hypothetical protein
MLRRLHLLLAALLATAGCDRAAWEGELPLRPLLYTEPAAQAAEGSSTEGSGQPEPELIGDPVAWPTEFETHTVRPTDATMRLAPATSPDALMQAVYSALVAYDAEALQIHLFTADELAAAARMGADAARRDAATTHDESMRLLEAFNPGPQSEARAGGIAALLRPSQVVVGRPRSITGAVVEEQEPVAMHWGNELTIQLVDTNSTFSLRFPKLLVTSDGIWKLAAAPTVDQRFRAFRALGIDRKPELMNPEHAPIPLSVGNFWHYRTRRPSGGDTATEFGVITQDGYRDEVTEVEDHGGYRVVRFRRVFDNPVRAIESFAWLVTPLRVYRCDRDCQRHAGDVTWTLNYAANQVPILTYPLIAGESWGAGGEDGRNNVFRIQPDRVAVEVPAGSYGESFEVSRITPRGRESRFFVPGIGVVLARDDAGFATTLEELTDYRVLQ